MPLERHIDDLTACDGIKFWMSDGECPVLCRVSHEALRDLAERVHFEGTDEKVFEAYRLKADDPFRDYARDGELRIAVGQKLLKLVADGVTDPGRLRRLTVESLLPGHWRAEISGRPH